MKKTILVIDNYDSFTYNLVHLVHELGLEVTVWRNDKFELSEVAAFDKIILSPGPGIPEEAGLLLPLIEAYADQKSIFGVCLGQQAIAEAFGGSLLNLGKPMHGIATDIQVIDRADITFNECPDSFKVGRYHSWVVNPNDLPKSLLVSATDATGEIMALRHQSFDVRGVQFHPESVLTEHGLQMMKNWALS